MLFPESWSHGPELHTLTSFPRMSPPKLTSFQSHCSWMFSTYYPHSVMPPSYLSECESEQENLSQLISLVWDGEYKQFVTLHICSYVLKAFQGLCHQEGSIPSGQTFFPLISVEGEYKLSTETFFIFLLSFEACTTHHQMNHRFPGRILRFIPHSIQMTRNINLVRGQGKKNPIHRSLRFSPESSNGENMNGCIAFQRVIVPICTNPHPNQDPQLIQGSRHLSPYKCILGSFCVALKI